MTEDQSQGTKTGAKTCWVITDGVIGMVSQALGLAEAVGRVIDLDIERKDISLAQPWASLPGAFWPPGVFGLNRRSGARLDPPWPDLILSCGRKSVGPALAVKRASKGKSFAVHIQHPHVALNRFDLIAAPSHDRLEGPNVIVTKGAVHRVNKANLDAIKATTPNLYRHLPKPLIAVLFGGDNKAYHLSPGLCHEVAEQLRAAARNLNAGMVVTTSRRTGAANTVLLERILSNPDCEFWDGNGENPYFNYLALADAIVVTGDSVNMVSEAATSGKPVYVVPLELAKGGARAAQKFEAFHETVLQAGAVRRFDGSIELNWTPTPLDEATRVAEIIAKQLQQHSGG